MIYKFIYMHSRSNQMKENRNESDKVKAGTAVNVQKNTEKFKFKQTWQII